MTTFVFFYLLGVLLAANICFFLARESGICRLSHLLQYLLIVCTSFVGLSFLTITLLIDVFTRHHGDPVLWQR